jgi:hypothetical protein
MDIRKANRRDKKRHKTINGMKVDNRNIFILEEEKRKKALKIKKEREEKERQQNGC